MIVDINAYHGNWPYWPLINHDTGSIIQAMDRYGIHKAFTASLRAIFSDPVRGNEETKAIVRAYPGRFYPAFVYSPYAAGRECYKQDCEEMECCLVKLFPLNHSYSLLEEPYIAELVDFCAQRGIPVMIPFRLMMTWRLPTLDLSTVAQLAAHYPNAVIILGSINYLFEYQTAREMLRAHSNIFLETSAMMALEGIANTVSDLGASRLLHGSGIPLQNPAIGPLKIHKAAIPDDEKRRILYQNALALFPALRKVEENAV